MINCIRMKVIRDQRSPEEILEEGLSSNAEATIGEVVDVIATLTEHVKGSGTYQKLIKELGPECEEAVEEFIISFACSVIATLTAQFKLRERPKCDA